MLKFVIRLSLLLLPYSISSQSLYFPPVNQNQWDTISSSTLGYCSENIDSLYQYLDEHNSKAFILLKDGKIVLEKYFGTFTQDSIWYWASAGKTLTAALVGIAQQENHLSIHDTTSSYLGNGWTNSPPNKEEKITIWHQITMSSGLDDNVGNQDCTDDSCLVFLADAGTRWAYHNAPYTLLSDVLETATGQNINIYTTQKIKNPTGMDGAYFSLGYNNVFFSTPRSMARFGLLLLAGGYWNNIPVIGDSAYFHDMINTSQTLNRSYGYLTWLNDKSEFMIPQSQFVFAGPMTPGAPANSYAALGKNGQIINVAPSENLVWIRMGNPPTSGSNFIAHNLNINIWKKINALDCNTSIKQHQNQSKVYPIPASDLVHIESKSCIKQIQLFDQQGKMLISKHPSCLKTNLKLNRITKGLYFLVLRKENTITTHKIIIN